MSWPRVIINRRHVRAEQITALLMSIIGRHFPEADNRTMGRLCREIGEQLWCDGAQMITEGDRIAAGLPPRNVEGLTVEELRAIEARLQIAMMSPPMMAPVTDQENFNG